MKKSSKIALGVGGAVAVGTAVAGAFYLKNKKSSNKKTKEAKKNEKKEKN